MSENVRFFPVVETVLLRYSFTYNGRSFKKKIVMKKLILCLAISAAAIVGHAQRIVHHHYVTYYNATTKEPDSVVWDVTPDMVSCPRVTRHDHFQADPDISDCATPHDYTNSHYDKGHLFNYADAECDSVDRIECFYMSNMLPQVHAFNAGDWETVEKYERGLAGQSTIHIIAGGIGSLGQTPGGVNIPEKMWKAIYANGAWTCWIMDNKSSSTHHELTFWEVPVASFDQQTGLQLH